MRTQLDRLTDQQRSIQAELEQAERELAQNGKRPKAGRNCPGLPLRREIFPNFRHR